MKKVSKLSLVKMIPSFFAYGMALACLVGAFVSGMHCLITGAMWSVLGLVLDPKFEKEQ